MSPTRRAINVVITACMLAIVALIGCGGGGDDPDAPHYALVIDGAPDPTTLSSAVVPTGEGFLPPGSTSPGSCSGTLPPPVFGVLGPYALRWRNEDRGASGSMGLGWVCNRGRNPPSWIATVPLAVGASRITVTMTAGGIGQSAGVGVTRGG